MSRRRYSGYRGRPAARDVLRVAGVVLAIVLVLAAACLMLGQRYIVYTDDGIRLELPFFQREQTPSPDASVTLDIVQQTRPPRADESQFHTD